MNIKILKNGLTLDYKSFVFSGGEVSVKLAATNYKFLFEKADHTTIIAHLQDSRDIMELAMIKNALEGLDETPVNLFMPYTPYARQDRICDKGEAFSLKVFCNFINDLNFNKVIICDPHSEVAPALLDNVKVISQFDIVNKHLDLMNRVRNCLFVAPDSGANKKTATLAGFFAHDSFVRADKLRDLTNGNIKETIVYSDNLKGRDVVICDDICDGGRTFIELAKVLKKKNAGKVILYVTHGIFSKGVKILFQEGIDEIWTTNSFKWSENPDEVNLYEKLNVLNLEERFGDLI